MREDQAGRPGNGLTLRADGFSKCLVPFDLPPPDPGFEFFVASRGMSKGISQSDGPQFIPKAFIEMGSLQIGTQWKNVTSTVAEGEAAIFLNWHRKFGAVQANAGINVKLQTSVKEPSDDKAFELNGALSGRWGRLGARVSAVYTPDDLGSTRQSVYLEGGPSYDVTKEVRLSANLGRRERAGSPDYTAFNAGVSAVLGKLTLDARYYDTAQSDLGYIYKNRGVVSARLAF